MADLQTPVSKSTGPRRVAPQSRIAKPDLAVLAGLAVITVVVATLVVRSPRAVGPWLDDGVYLATGKALAEGRGYRHLELPGEPLQTKYPPLYPLLLAGAWRASPGFPSLPLIQIFSAACWGAACWLAYRAMRRLWDVPWYVPGAAVVLSAFNPAAMNLMRSALTEPLYALLAMAALRWLPGGGEDRGSRIEDRGSRIGDRGSRIGDRGNVDRGLKEDGGPNEPLPDPRSSIRNPRDGRAVMAAALGCGLCAAGAYLTRTIGLALIAAVVGHALLGRRWRAAILTALPPAGALVGWHLWRQAATRANATIPGIEAFRYDLDYSLWIPQGLSALAWVAYQNTSAVALEFLALLVPLSTAWVRPLPETGLLAGGTPLYGLLVLLVLVALLGWLTTWRAGRSGIHLYVVFYLGLVLVWPMTPARFLIPLLPLLTAMLLAGLRQAVLLPARVLAGREGIRAAARRGATPAGGLAGGLAVFVAGILALPNLLYLALQPDRAALAEAERQREALVQFFQTQTPSRAVLCASQNGYIALRTGRKCVPFLPYEDPVANFYPRDRRLGSCGRVATTEWRAADLRMMRLRTREYLQISGVRYIAPLPPGHTKGQAFAAYAKEAPYLNLVTQLGPQPVYEVLP